MGEFSFTRVSVPEESSALPIPAAESNPPSHRYLDVASLAGMILAWGALTCALVLEGGELKTLINLPAGLLVFGGTLGATVASSRANQIAALPALVRKVFLEQSQDIGETIMLLARLSDKARRHGMLSLEADMRKMDNAFLKQGLQLAIDAEDPNTIREILLTDIQQLELRHRAGERVFATMGGFAPTLGIIGTVVGLIHMLSNLNDPGKMGPLIASAFIATLYGVASANLLFLPMSAKLRARSAEEVLLRETLLEGILAIQAGDSPRIVEEKLKVYLAPRLRHDLERTQRP